jgi:hypothetical protein
VPNGSGSSSSSSGGGGDGCSAGVGQYPDRWGLFDPATEYARLGFFHDPPSNRGASGGGAASQPAETAKGWRLYRQDFSADNVYSDGKPACLSATYPEAFVVPASLSDAQVRPRLSLRARVLLFLKRAQLCSFEYSA